MRAGKNYQLVCASVVHSPEESSYRNTGKSGSGYGYRTWRRFLFSPFIVLNECEREFVNVIFDIRPHGHESVTRSGN